MVNLTLFAQIFANFQDKNIHALFARFSTWWIQVINATLPSLLMAAAKTSLGVKYPCLFLGLLFKISSAFLTASLSKLVPFGKYCLTKPFRFSLAPLSQLW